MYSSSCCSCSFEPEIIKIGHSSHKMYSNNILNLQESTTILNACTKKVWKLIEFTTYIISVSILALPYTILMSRYQHGYPWHSLATPPYRPLLPAGPHGYILYRRRYVRAGRPTFARPCEGTHRSTSLMSSFLLLQQCPACLVRLTWIAFVMGGTIYQPLRSGRIWHKVNF